MKRLEALAVVLAGLVACADAPAHRVLLVGIDGATLRVAEPMLAAGALPNLRAVAEEGAVGPLRSLHPLFSPRIWASIATGMTPERHGILGFAYRSEEGAKRLYQSHDRKVRALWNIAAEAGLEVAVVNWWTTYPPEQGVGVVVSDQAYRHANGRQLLRGPFVAPAGWEKRAAALLALREPLTSWRDPFRDGSALPAGIELQRLSEAFLSDEAVVRTALAIEAERHPDLLMVFLKGIDRISHRLFPTLEPPESLPRRLRYAASEREVGAAALRDYYRYTDALIGLLVERFGPRDLVMVVSDHGFESRVRSGVLRGEHREKAARDGVVFARGRDVSRGRAEGVSVLDVTPTVLAWLGLPVADDMDGKPASFLAVEPRRIASYETRAARPGPAAPSPLEPEILEELRELGYFE